MAFPTSVNNQITDSVTQAHVSDTTGGAATELLGEIIRALGVATRQGVSGQHQAEIVHHAASIVGIGLLENHD